MHCWLSKFIQLNDSVNEMNHNKVKIVEWVENFNALIYWDRRLGCCFVDNNLVYLWWRIGVLNKLGLLSLKCWQRGHKFRGDFLENFLEVFVKIRMSSARIWNSGIPKYSWGHFFLWSVLLVMMLTQLFRLNHAYYCPYLTLSGFLSHRFEKYWNNFTVKNKSLKDLPT